MFIHKVGISHLHIQKAFNESSGLGVLLGGIGNIFMHFCICVITTKPRRRGVLPLVLKLTLPYSKEC